MLGVLFVHRGAVGFHCFTENMNGELYRKILTENLFPNASNLLGKIMDFPTRQRPKAHRQVNFLKKNAQKFLIGLLTKPYKNLMGNNDVKGGKEGKKSIGLDEFLLIIQLEWDNIDKSILSNLCSGMKKRLEAVIEKGGLTIDH